MTTGANLGSSQLHQHRVPPVPKFVPHVPRGLRTVIRKALNVDPAERFQSAFELADALGKVSPANNWETAISPTSDIQWKSRRDGKPSLVVRLTKTDRRWGVEIYGESGGVLRKRQGDQWQSGLTRPQANDFLKRLFDELG